MTSAEPGAEPTPRRRRLVRRLAIALLAVLVVGGLAAFAGWRWFLGWEPDRDRYPLRGIDVSHHQGPIDWPEVAEDDVAFAYIKATEGGSFVDERFATNWAQARAAGIPSGAYHFFTFCRTGAEQARNFVDTVPAEPDALAPAVDLEFGGNCGDRPSNAELRRELDAFLDVVEQAYGREAIFYVTPDFLDAYADALPARDFWWRAIISTPDGSWRFWQFHNGARVDGIDGPVDLNVFEGDRAAFDAWRRS